MVQFPFVRPSVSDKKDQECLNNQRNGNQYNIERAVQNPVALKRKDNDKRKQQPGDGGAREFLQKYIFKIADAFVADHEPTGNHGQNQWNYHEKHYRQ